MRNSHSRGSVLFRSRHLLSAILVSVSLFLGALALSPSTLAQQTGPLPPVAPSDGSFPTPTHGPATSGTPAPPPKAIRNSTSPISNEAPAIPVVQIVQKFGERELEFKKERDNYTYTQTFVVQTVDADDRPDGEYRMTSDILFTPDGKRYEKVTFAPPPTLERIQLSQQDLDDLEHVQPFVLTSDELPKYDIKYVGREQLDDLATYVFDVAPKKIEKNQRYFQGRVWVEDHDLEIVKTDGKAVPDIITKHNENIFPRFETFRENIEGHYWFPTYTRSDDVLHFSTGPIHMRMTVRYANYKRFGSTIRIGSPIEIKKDTPPH